MFIWKKLLKILNVPLYKFSINFWIHKSAFYIASHPGYVTRLYLSMKSFLFEGNSFTEWSFNVSHIGLPWLTFLWIHFIHNSHELWETVCPEIHDGQVQVHKHLQFCALWTLLKKDYLMNTCIMLVKNESKSGHRAKYPLHSGPVKGSIPNWKLTVFLKSDWKIPKVTVLYCVLKNRMLNM